jgi:23S rRNA (guanine2445-N2)-methyltransferase / 23S rRNA (guanine2069-N7)-methyltransferase
MPTRFLATCSKQLEPLLAEELQGLGVAAPRITLAGVHFQADLVTAYRACLWSRLASRILLPLGEFEAADADALYQAVQTIPWQEHLGPDQTLAVDFSGASATITNTMFGAQKVKDAIVDQFRAATGRRPSVDPKDPQVRISARLHATRLSVALDLAGGSLHRRGYRLAGGEAPLKENLAAAVLVRAGWAEQVRAGAPLVDPMCGSGTLLAEAALMAADIAPGLFRPRFGFERWRGHHPAAWRQLREEAQQRRRAGLERPRPGFYGWDSDARVLQLARENLQRAGLETRVHLGVRELAQLAPPARERGRTGLLVTNPPYGERLSDLGSLGFLYRHLGQRLREQFAGWQAAVLTGNPELGRTMGLRAKKRYALFNGSIACRLLLFEVSPEWFVDAPYVPATDHPESQPGRATARGTGKDSKPPEPAPDGESAAAPADAPAGGPGAAMFANRIRRNRRTIGRWARRQGISCFRLYDADMKEYALAVDVYGDWVQVQEYAAPATVDPEKARRRLDEALRVLPAALEVPAARVIFKRRERQRGAAQYQRLGRQAQLVEVTEHGSRLLVNLTDYIDTGLFLDHRPLRRLIRERARNARFLNLFCYTATATVNAAAGGAARTTSVDLSPNYLHWARRNLALNGFSDRRHALVEADCLAWLEQEREHYDLILLDPPTFSNSKKLGGTLDIQRDHVRLLRLAARRLAPGGLLYFSTNFRRFRLDEAALPELECREITRATIDKDFQGNPRIHRCWEVRLRGGTVDGSRRTGVEP